MSKPASLAAWLEYCAAGVDRPIRNLNWMIDCAETCETHAEAKQFIEAYAEMLPWETVASNMEYFLQEGVSEAKEGMFAAAFREMSWAHKDAEAAQ
jgi:hypothetical protein